jgi:hypothetical protein
MAAMFEALKEHYYTTLTNVTLPELNGDTYQKVLLLILPYLFYTYLWHFPTLWCQMSESLGMHSSNSMKYIAHCMKIIQFTVLLKFGGVAFPHYFSIVNEYLPKGYEVNTYEFEMNMMAAIDIALVGFGQALNYGVYKSLGTVGTFYGVRFGHHVPWVTGFPYNLGISDPQYWGSILTLIGSLNLLQTKNNTFYVWALILSYFYMMAVEYGQRTPAYNSKKSAGRITASTSAVSIETKTTPKVAEKKKKVRARTPTPKKPTTPKKPATPKQDLSKLKCVTLRNMLKKKGLKQTGRKAELIERLQNA